MAVAALITWIITAFGGLYMLVVWLIENDVTGPGAVASRLPAPVVFSHLTLAVTGLSVWVAYLLLDREALAWTACAILAGIILLGWAMFARWIPVYRGPAVAAEAPQLVRAAAGRGSHTAAAHADRALPPESQFPVVVVLAHGLLAVTTVTLVVLTALGVDGS